MSSITLEQENHILDQLNARQMTHKIQTSEMSQSVKKPVNTPICPGKKTPLQKSSRKAFGNVSNVLRLGSQHSFGVKGEIKKKAQTKDTSNLKSEQMVKSVVTDPEVDPKFLDEIEEMHPIDDQLMSDMKDPITEGLYAIDEQIVLNMEFDSDMTEYLLSNKLTIDLNDFL